MTKHPLEYIIVSVLLLSMLAVIGFLLLRMILLLLLIILVILLLLPPLLLLILIILLLFLVSFFHLQITGCPLRKHLQRNIPSIIILQLPIGEGCIFPRIDTLPP